MNIFCSGFLCRSVLLLFSLTAIVANASAANPKSEAGGTVYDATRYGSDNIHWRQGQYIDMCKKGSAFCVGLKIPKRVGKVELVVPGPIIRGAGASWLAVSKFETFVCAVLKGRVTVACAKIMADPFPLQHANVGFEISSDNRLHLVVGPKHPGVDTAQLALIAKPFRKAFWESARVLQGEFDYAASSYSAFASSLSICDKPQNDPGPAPYPSCTLVEEDGILMWACPVIGHHEGDEDDGGGGGGGGGGDPPEPEDPECT